RPVPVRGLFYRWALRIKGQPRPARRAKLLQSLFYLGPPPLPAELLDQEFHPVSLLVLAIPELVEHAKDGLGDVEDLAGRQEIEEDSPRGAEDRRSASGGDAKAQLVWTAGRPHARAKAEVIDRGDLMVLRAALEGDLEFPGQRRAQGVAQQIAAE